MSIIANISLRHIKKQITKAYLKERHLDSEGFQFHFYDSGIEKPALLLLNGFGISAEFQWYPVLSKLAENYRLIMVNLVCFGDSK